MGRLNPFEIQRIGGPGNIVTRLVLWAGVGLVGLGLAVGFLAVVRSARVRKESAPPRSDLVSELGNFVRQGPPWRASSFGALAKAWEAGDPSDLHDRANWTGGSYDLAIEIGSTDDASVEQTLLAIWLAAGVKGTFSRDEGNQRTHVSVALTLKSLESHVNGVVRLPGGRDIVCGVSRMTEESGPDWLVFYLPLGALGRADKRVGAFPFGDDGGPRSLGWRQPLDSWLAGIAGDVYRDVRFKLALVGWEAAFEAHADDLAGEAPVERSHAYLLATPTGLRYYEATK